MKKIIDKMYLDYARKLYAEWKASDFKGSSNDNYLPTEEDVMLNFAEWIVRKSGNASVLREALEAMLDECCNLCDVPNQMTESGHACNWRDRWSGCQSKAIDKALAALSEPARNCDVGTPQEQYKRFKKFCFDNMRDGMNEPRCSNCPLGKTKASCYFDWAQMLYEKKEEENSNG